MKQKTSQGDNERRVGLARALSKLGFCSRTEAAALIKAGRVQLNGEVKHDPETPVRLRRDRIAVDGARVAAAAKAYWVMHKPAGLVTTANDERGRKTIYSLLPADAPWMGPVGRLDMASEGLLLLTNDTEWAARITAPESHLDKIYHVQPDRLLSDLPARLEKGVEEGGDFLRAKTVRLLSGDKTGWLEITLDEGKNRHIRRMLDVCGIEVLRLVRVAIGRLELADMAVGEARPLLAEERDLLG